MSEIIKAIQNPKIREVSQEVLGKLITRIGAIYGLPIITEPNQKAILVDHILRWYPGLTPQEILYAMEWNLTLSEPVKPYGVLSVSFIAEIMAKYREERAKELKKKQSKQALPERREVTGKELWEGLKEMKEFPFAYAWGKVFEYLEESEIVKMSIDEKRDFKKQVASNMNLGRKPTESELRNECYKQLIEKQWEK